MALSSDRVEVLARIEEYERLGLFDHDVENDPPTRPLKAGEVDYTLSKWTTRIQTKFANHMARRHFDGLIKEGQLVIKEIRGIENYLAVADRGVIITSNHFHAFEQYAVYKTLQPHLGKRDLYKVVREGNYTSFPGLYGYFFRHCNTLPLAADHKAFREFRAAIPVLLGRGEKILIYPEQGMWWNYRKPRPLKPGAFHLAATAMAPVLPFFLTMEDTGRLDPTGYPIQAYTVNILPAIFPDPAQPARVNADMLCCANYDAWKSCYEDFYGIPLTYTTESPEN